MPLSTTATRTPRPVRPSHTISGVIVSHKFGSAPFFSFGSDFAIWAATNRSAYAYCCSRDKERSALLYDAMRSKKRDEGGSVRDEGKERPETTWLFFIPPTSSLIPFFSRAQPCPSR